MVDVPNCSGNSASASDDVVVGNNLAANDVQDTDQTAVKAVVELADNLDRQLDHDTQNRSVGRRVSDTSAGETVNAVNRVITRATARPVRGCDGGDDGHQRRRDGSAQADGPDDADTLLLDADDEKQTWRDVQQIDMTDISRPTTEHWNWIQT